MEKGKTPASASRPIEVTVISCEDLLMNKKPPAKSLLTNKKPPAKNTVYVTVKTGPFLSYSTGVDPEGRSFPSWNERLSIDLPEQARFITVEARSADMLIASAAVPVTDFCGGCLPEGHLSFVSYRMTGADGDKNGIINLSIRVKGGGAQSSKPLKEGKPFAASFSKPLAAEGKPCGAGVVTGIPVSYKY